MTLSGTLLSLLLLSLLYVVYFRKRTFDLFSIFTFFFVYNYCLFIGQYIDFDGFSYVHLYTEIDEKYKWFFVYTTFTLILTVMINDKLINSNSEVVHCENKPNYLVDIHDYVSFFTCVIFVIYIVININTLGGSKAELKSGSGFVLSLLVGFCQILIFTSVKLERKIGFLICLIVTLLLIVVGSRANIVFIIIIGIYASFHGRVINLGLSKYLYRVFLIIPIFLGVLILKVVYKEIKAGDLNGILDKLSGIDFGLLGSLLLVEPKSVGINLITLCENIDYSDKVITLLTAPIPILSKLYSEVSGVEIANSSMFLKDNFYDVDFGLASSSFGEACSYFGIESFVIIPLILGFSLCIANYYMGRFSVVSILFSPTIIILFFYMHRTPILTSLSMFKLPLLILFVFVIIRFFHRRFKFLTKTRFL